jgi:hypothetical protein
LRRIRAGTWRRKKTQTPLQPGPCVP